MKFAKKINRLVDLKWNKLSDFEKVRLSLFLLSHENFKSLWGILGIMSVAFYLLFIGLMGFNYFLFFPAMLFSFLSILSVFKLFQQEKQSYNFLSKQLKNK